MAHNFAAYSRCLDALASILDDLLDGIKVVAGTEDPLERLDFGIYFTKEAAKKLAMARKELFPPKVN